jgi:hypothetical protein
VFHNKHHSQISLYKGTLWTIKPLVFSAWQSVLGANFKTLPWVGFATGGGGTTDVRSAVCVWWFWLVRGESSLLCIDSHACTLSAPAHQWLSAAFSSVYWNSSSRGTRPNPNTRVTQSHCCSLRFSFPCPSASWMLGYGQQRLYIWPFSSVFITPRHKAYSPTLWHICFSRALCNTS